MRQYTTPIVMITVLLVGYLATNRHVPVQAQGGTQSYAAIANDLGSLQPTGPYEVVPNWPKDSARSLARKSGRSGPDRVCSPRARTASTTSSVVRSR